MRFTPLAALVSVLAVATCTPVERGAVAPPSGPAFAHVQDLDGTPDMIVDAKTLATSWVVYDQELKESFCSIEEANLAPGKYRLLRFTVITDVRGDDREAQQAVLAGGEVRLLDAAERLLELLVVYDPRRGKRLGVHDHIGGAVEVLHVGERRPTRRGHGAALHRRTRCDGQHRHQGGEGSEPHGVLLRERSG